MILTHPPFPASAPPTPVDPFAVYIPSPEALAESDDTFPLPDHLRAIINTVSQSTPLISKMASEYGKPADTVDWGEEVDYSGYEWFKDPPPPRPEVSVLSIIIQNHPALTRCSLLPSHP